MKICITCKISKDESKFHKNKKQKDGLQNECKDCCKVRDKKYYQQYGNKKYQDRAKQHYERNRTFITKYKKIFGKCIDCGITDWRVLQFDHIKNKKCQVSDMVNGSSLQNIKNEIRKCKMRCANCHQIKTHHSVMG